MLSNSKILLIVTFKALEILNSVLIVTSRLPASIIAICEREIPHSREIYSCVNPFSVLIFRKFSPKAFLKSLHILLFYDMLLLVTVAVSDINL